MPSFDIVSEIDSVETNNAVANAQRILGTRFDFKGVEASIEYKDEQVTLKAESDFQLQQLQSMLRDACAKRGVAANSLNALPIERMGKTFKQAFNFKQGIDQALAKKLVKQIKDNKFKVQTAIQGDKIRVTGKKRDDLQNVIAFLKSEDFGQALQFNNFRD